MAVRHVAVSISPTARARVRALTFTLTGVTGRRVTMSQAIEAACAVAEQQSPDQLAAYLPTHQEGTA